MRNGHLGKLERIEIVFPSDPTPVGVQPDMPVPPELNYDMWLGPTAVVSYTEKRVHDVKQHHLRPNWMRISTYAQGMIANWGGHYFSDVAQWANNSEHSGPIEVEGKESSRQPLEHNDQLQGQLSVCKWRHHDLRTDTEKYAKHFLTLEATHGSRLTAIQEQLPAVSRSY